MRREFACLTIALSLGALPALGQTARTRKAVVAHDKSKAYVWAEAVTDFIADRRLLESFRPADVEERFKALIPLGSLKIINRGGIGEEGGKSPGGNLEKGVAGLEYELGDKEGGMAEISWVTIFMPRTDPDEVDLVPRVTAALDRKLLRPWRRFPSHQAGVYYWHQRKDLLEVKVEVDNSIPEKHGTPNEGPWVIVQFARVGSFGEQ